MKRIPDDNDDLSGVLIDLEKAEKLLGAAVRKIKRKGTPPAIRKRRMRKEGDE